MSKKDYSPLTPGTMIVGMPLRDYFAAAALQGLHASLTETEGWPSERTIEVMARLAYRQADAMLAVRDISND